MLFCLSLFLKFDGLDYFFYLILFDKIDIAPQLIIKITSFLDWWFIIPILNSSYLWYHQILMNKNDRDLTIKSTLDVKLIYLDLSLHDNSINYSQIIWI